MTKDKARQWKKDLDRLLAPKLFKAICDPNRIAIMHYLGERCAARAVGQIAETLPVDVSVVSRHLSILRDAGILIAQKAGKEVRYSLNTRNLIVTLRAIADAFEACCPDQCVMNNETCTEPRLSRPGKGQRRSRTTEG